MEFLSFVSVIRLNTYSRVATFDENWETGDSMGFEWRYGWEKIESLNKLKRYSDL